MAQNINATIDTKIDELLGKSPKNQNVKNILILSGGGIKGIAHIGVLKAFENNNLLKPITTIVGASIGGIIAILHTIGYTPDEMFNFITLLNVAKLKNFQPTTFLNKYGLDDGKKLDLVLSKLLEAKQINPSITFKELYEKTKIHIILSTVCLNNKQVYYLSHRHTPNLSILLACRMTSCVPLYYTPIKYKNKLFIDGACIDNYPIQLFEDRINECIGVYLTENQCESKEIANMEDFLFNLIHCLQESMTCNAVKGYEKQTIMIYLPSGSAMDFDIDQTKKQEFFDRGFSAGSQYVRSQFVHTSTPNPNPNYNKKLK